MLGAILDRGSGPALELLRGAALRQPRRAHAVEATPQEAQTFVNFVVLAPRPDEETEELVGTVRREAAHADLNKDILGPPWTPATVASTCSFRFEWQVNAQLRVRCLQQLPELPNLYPFESIHPAIGGRTESCFRLSGGRAGWIGVDSARRRCASVLSFGTLLHVRVEPDYHALDEELVAALECLAPVSMTAVRAVNATPFAELTYFSRYPRPYIDCLRTPRPSSLFNLRWPFPNAGAHRWSADMTLAAHWFGYPPGGGELGRGAQVPPRPEWSALPRVYFAFELIVKAWVIPLSDDGTSTTQWLETRLDLCECRAIRSLRRLYPDWHH